MPLSHGTVRDELCLTGDEAATGCNVALALALYRAASKALMACLKSWLRRYAIVRTDRQKILGRTDGTFLDRRTENFRTDGN